MSDFKFLFGAQSVFKWSQTTPKETAIVNGSVDICYLDMAIHIAQFVKTLKKCGITRGMIVGINCNDKYISLTLGLANEVIGAITLFLSNNDLFNIEITSHCDALFTDTIGTYKKYSGIFIRITQNWLDCLINKKISSSDLNYINNNENENETVFIWGTSGTTGKKKYFEVKRKTIESQAHLRHKIYFNKNKKINYISLYGPLLGTAFLSGRISLTIGSKIIFSNIYNFLSDINNNDDCKSTIILRDAYYLSQNFTNIKIDKKLDSLRVIGALLPTDIRDWLNEHVSHRVVNSFSSNETGQISEVGPNGVGTIYPEVNVKIIDENRNTVNHGETGNIAIKCPQMITEYLWNDELNSNHFDDGWFISSDVGYAPDKNKLVVIGRSDSLLNIGGVKIAPGPFEYQIKLVGGVSDCVLLSDDVIFGPENIIVCIENDSDIRSVEHTIKSYLKRNFKHSSIFLFSKFPRTETGKAKRNIIRKLVEEHLLKNPVKHR